jgi:hypothetical protein
VRDKGRMDEAGTCRLHSGQRLIAEGSLVNALSDE